MNLTLDDIIFPIGLHDTYLTGDHHNNTRNKIIPCDKFVKISYDNFGIVSIENNDLNLIKEGRTGKSLIMGYSYADYDFGYAEIVVKDISYLDDISCELEIGGSRIAIYENLLAANSQFNYEIKSIDDHYIVMLPLNINYILLNKNASAHQKELFIKTKYPIDVYIYFFSNINYALNPVQELLIYQYSKKLSYNKNKFKIAENHPTFIFSLYFDNYEDNLIDMILNFPIGDGYSVQIDAKDIKRQITVPIHSTLKKAYEKILKELVCSDLINPIISFLGKYKCIYTIDLHGNLNAGHVTKPKKSINLSRMEYMEFDLNTKEKFKAVNVSTINCNILRIMGDMCGLAFSN